MMKNLFRIMIVMVLTLVLTLTLTCNAYCEEGNTTETPAGNENSTTTDPADGGNTQGEEPQVVEVKATGLTVEGSFENSKEQDTSKYIQVAPNGTYQLKVTVAPTDTTSKVTYTVQNGYGWAIEVNETGLIKAKTNFCNKAVIEVRCDELIRYVLVHIEEAKPSVSTRYGVWGEKLKTVSLPSHWYWNDSSEYIDEGTNYFTATYRPSDIYNKWYGLTQRVKVVGEDEDEEEEDTSDYIYFDRSSTSKNAKIDSTLKFYIKRRNSRTIKKYEITVKDENGNVIYEDDEKFSSSKSSYTIELEMDEDTYNDVKSIVVQIKAWDNKDESWKSGKFKYNITGQKVTVKKDGIIGSKMTRKFGYLSSTFRDVKASNWFYPYVVNTYEYNLLLGSGGYFKPNGNITVAETIALASRLNVIYNGKSESFDQTKGTNWYDTYVDYATKNSIISSNMFTDYNKAITREYFVKVMYNALPAKEYEEINNIKMNDIPDYKVIHKYANEVYAFYNAGILTGTDRWGTFKPDAKITRAEVAAIVSREAKLVDREYFTIK